MKNNIMVEGTPVSLSLKQIVSTEVKKVASFDQNVMFIPHYQRTFENILIEKFLDEALQTTEFEMYLGHILITANTKKSIAKELSDGQQRFTNLYIWIRILKSNPDYQELASYLPNFDMEYIENDDTAQREFDTFNRWVSHTLKNSDVVVGNKLIEAGKAVIEWNEAHTYDEIAKVVSVLKEAVFTVTFFKNEQNAVQAFINANSSDPISADEMALISLKAADNELLSDSKHFAYEKDKEKLLTSATSFFAIKASSDDFIENTEDDGMNDKFTSSGKKVFYNFVKNVICKSKTNLEEFRKFYLDTVTCIEDEIAVSSKNLFKRVQPVNMLQIIKYYRPDFLIQRSYDLLKRFLFSEINLTSYASSANGILIDNRANVFYDKVILSMVSFFKNDKNQNKTITEFITHVQGRIATILMLNPSVKVSLDLLNNSGLKNTKLNSGLIYVGLTVLNAGVDFYSGSSIDHIVGVNNGLGINYNREKNAINRIGNIHLVDYDTNSKMNNMDVADKENSYKKLSPAYKTFGYPKNFNISTVTDADAFFAEREKQIFEELYNAFEFDTKFRDLIFSR